MFFFACKQEKPKNESTELTGYKKAIDELGKKRTTPINADSILTAWLKYNLNAKVLADTDLNANVKYNLGKMYAQKNIDTAKMYLQQGLELIEQSKDYLNIKARIYTGMGNLANVETLEHQANYYYNKAAIIVLSDTTVRLSAMAKSIILFK